jgi:ABC-type transport system involved in multi-copper enzyme maturation permease subunit
MTWLPIVNRELRVNARRSRTYWLRAGAAGAALVLSAWICLLASRQQPPATLGPNLFAYLTVLAFSYCLLVGPFFTADCLSEEKRDGTLGLLFLTDLHSYDVVLGKWVAASLAGFHGLLAMLPALGLPLLLGGVTPGEYGRVALAILNAMWLSLTAGMFVSLLSREQAKATLAAAVLTLGLTGLLPGLALVITTRFFTHPMTGAPTLALLSPAFTGYLAMDASFRTSPGSYWLSLELVHGLGWLFLLTTVVMVPRVWRDHPAEKPTTSRWFWRLGYTNRWRRVFRRRLERNPVAALAARLRWPHYVFWTLVALVTVNVYWLTIGYRLAPGSYQFHAYFSTTLVFTNRVWVTVMACRFWIELRRTGTLELILTTPVPVRTILRGHWRALTILCAGPVLVIGGLHVFYAVGSWWLNGGLRTANLVPPGYLLASASGSFMSFITDVVAICWMGAWFSVSCRRATLAIFLTFAWVVLLPWTLSYVLPGLANLPPAFWNYALRHRWLQVLLPTTAAMNALVHPTAWVLKNLVFTLWARHQLFHHFRSAAAQVDAPPHRGRRWWQRGRSPARTEGTLALATGSGSLGLPARDRT